MKMPFDANVPPPFLKGANLPWVHYGIDFGANAWRPSGGVSHADERDLIDQTFARLAGGGVTWIRWFLFCDGRAGIRYTTGGRPEGLDDFVIRDIDAALDAARRHRVRIMFVLLDFLWCEEARMVRGVQLGGRGDVLRARMSRAALLDTVFQPVLDRYGHEPEIFAWDIINEPEWVRSLPLLELRKFVGESAALIHEMTSHPATVGSAGVRWRENYLGLGLDFYQAHWYDKLDRDSPLETPVSSLGFDRPVLLGEFPTRGSKRTPDEIMATAQAAGYAGAFYWSVLAKDEATGEGSA